MEIGSEFHLDLSSLSQKQDNLFEYLKEYKDLFLYDSGRSAIREFAALLKDEDEVLLPEYICESVINCFDIKRVRFYRIKDDFSINLESLESKINPNTKVIFLMHYFGSLQADDILCAVKEIAEHHSLVILEDTTHSLFSKKRTIGDYMVCSIRKWMPISKGGILYIKNNKLGLPSTSTKKSIDNKRIEGFILKYLFLNNKMDCNAEYRAIFKKCEDDLDNQKENYFVSDLNRFIIECIDVNKLVSKRKQNAFYLLEKIAQKNDLHSCVRFCDDNCPFALPIRVNNRDAFRHYLINKHIYCAVHWPSDGIRDYERPQSKRNAEEMISLPVDQRYDEKDMDYLINAISDYEGDLLF